MRTGLVLLMMSVFLMCGCSGAGGGSTGTADNGGAGGSTGTTTDNGGAGTADAARTGFITMNFVAGPQKGAVLRAQGSSLPSPSEIRVVVRKIITTAFDETNDVGEVVTVTTSDTIYRQIIDVVLANGESSQIEVPQDTGYTLDAISYTSSGGRNVMLKYGTMSGINVTAGAATPVSITLDPIDARIAPQASVLSGAVLSVPVSNAGAPLRSGGNLRVADSAISDLFSYNATLSSFQATAPTLAYTDSSRTLYFQGLFFLADAFLDPIAHPATDNWQNWTYYYPNPTFSNPDAPVTCTVTPPGVVDVTITY